MGFLLFCIALILFIPLTIVNLVIVLHRDFSFKNFFEYFYQTAIDLDSFGNRNFRTLFNKLLIQNNGYQFGDPRETISSVLGKNELTGTLTNIGRFLVFILDNIDENHCQKSIMHIK